MDRDFGACGKRARGLDRLNRQDAGKPAGGDSRNCPRKARSGCDASALRYVLSYNRRRAARVGLPPQSGRRFGRSDRGIAGRRGDSGRRDRNRAAAPAGDSGCAQLAKSRRAAAPTRLRRRSGRNGKLPASTRRIRICQKLRRTAWRIRPPAGAFCRAAARGPGSRSERPLDGEMYALRRLAEQIPAGSEQELSAPDRQLLRSLRQEHTEALRSQAAEIDRLLRPVLEPVSGVPLPEPDGSTFPADWQPAAEQLFQTARRVEKQLACCSALRVWKPPVFPGATAVQLAQLFGVDAIDRSAR